MSLQPVPWITPFATRQGLLLYHDLTGRMLRLDRTEIDPFRSGDSQAPHRDKWLDRGFWVEEIPRVDEVILPLYPMHCRWAMFAAAPQQPIILAERRVGAASWQARPLNGLESFVWSSAQGDKTTGDILDFIEMQIGGDARARALELLLGWTHGECQLIKMIQRQDIEGNTPDMLATELKSSYDAHCD